MASTVLLKERSALNVCLPGRRRKTLNTAQCSREHRGALAVSGVKLNSLMFGNSAVMTERWRSVQLFSVGDVLQVDAVPGRGIRST